MLTVRRGNDRGHVDHGWLDTYHTFSFADYRDPEHMGFKSLRVINEDRVQPGQGFGQHPHHDMEIITYVLAGELEHRDSMGNHGVIRPGVVQYMAAGTGVEHSEFNPSSTEPVHLIQIWIFPDRKGVAPSYEQRAFPSLADAGELTLLASPDGRDGSIRINQDAHLLAAALRKNQQVDRPLKAGRGAWIQVLRGGIELNGTSLDAGDGASLVDEPSARIAARQDAEVLLFDLV